MESLLGTTAQGARDILLNRQRLRATAISLTTRSIDLRPLSEFEVTFEWDQSRVRLFLEIALF